MIIAEIGINHQGNWTIARELALIASECHADAVKLQTYKAELLAPPGPKRDMLKKYELSKEDTIRIKRYCEGLGIMFLSTPFDKESVDFLDQLVPMFKIGSGQTNDADFVEYIAKKKKPMIVSTGMSEFSDIRHVLSRVEVPVTLLHCVSQYPTKPEDADLRRLQRMMLQFSCPIGYSDHTEGIEICLAAKALGASVIEKHITLDKNQEGPDHKCSATPEEFKALVKGIRKIELACKE